MMWLTTLILLGLFAWLLMNGINEKNWVDNHLHDPAVASDPGILPTLGASVVGEERLERATQSLKGTGEKVVEKTADMAERVSDATGKAIERTTDAGKEFTQKVRQGDGPVGERLDKARAKLGELGDKGRQAVENNNTLSNARERISDRTHKLGERFAETVNKPRDGDGPLEKLADRLTRSNDKPS